MWKKYARNIIAPALTKNVGWFTFLFVHCVKLHLTGRLISPSMEQYHPDMNKGPGSEEKFKEISAAYEVILLPIYCSFLHHIYLHIL
jgi:hypothetical protein